MNDKKLRYLLRWIKNLEKVEINKDEKFYYIANLRVLYKIKKEHMYLNPEAFNTKNGDINYRKYVRSWNRGIYATYRMYNRGRK